MDLKLDIDGDLAIENGDLVLIRGTEAIAQDISIRLQWYLGEWYQDTRQGIPYRTQIFGKVEDLNVVRGIFRKAILSTPGVKEISNFDVTLDGGTRALRVVFDCKSVEGDFPYDKELII